jgi:WD40 repeat protein
VQSLSFSPDGQLVASGFEDGNIILWDSVAGIPLSEPLRSDGTEVSSLSFSPDGQVLASGSRGGLNQLWTLGLIALQDKACGMAGRALTLEEWQRYFGERDYHPVCGGSSS